jgi:hypothetical protein
MKTYQGDLAGKANASLGWSFPVLCTRIYFLFTACCLIGLCRYFRCPFSNCRPMILRCGRFTLITMGHFTECSLNVPWMFTECSLCVLWMFFGLCRYFRCPPFSNCRPTILRRGRFTLITSGKTHATDGEYLWIYTNQCEHTSLCIWGTTSVTFFIHVGWPPHFVGVKPQVYVPTYEGYVPWDGLEDGQSSD